MYSVRNYFAKWKKPLILSIYWWWQSWGKSRIGQSIMIGGTFGDCLRLGALQGMVREYSLINVFSGDDGSMSLLAYRSCLKREAEGSKLFAWVPGQPELHNETLSEMFLIKLYFITYSCTSSLVEYENFFYPVHSPLCALANTSLLSFIPNLKDIWFSFNYVFIFRFYLAWLSNPESYLCWASTVWVS